MSDFEVSRLTASELRAYRAGVRDGRRDETRLSWGMLALLFFCVAALAIQGGWLV